MPLGQPEKVGPMSDMATQFFFTKADVLLANFLKWLYLLPFFSSHYRYTCVCIYTTCEGQIVKLKYGGILCFVYDYRKQILLQIES